MEGNVGSSYVVGDHLQWRDWLTVCIACTRAHSNQRLVERAGSLVDPFPFPGNIVATQSINNIQPHIYQPRNKNHR